MTPVDVRGWLARHERVADAVLALVVLGVMLPPLLRHQGCLCGPLPWWGWLLVVGQCVPLVWRRRWPFAVALASGLLAGVHGASSLPEAPLAFAALVGLYSLAAHGSRQQALLGAGIAVIAIGVALLADGPDADAQDVTVNYLVFATAWLLGDSARSRRERSAELEARVTQTERAQEAEADRAVAQERARLAREMHDVLAHSVALMVVQAEAGPVVVRRDPERAVHAFDAISATGKEALTELRRLLGVLRTDADDRLEPQPGLDQLPGLADGCRDAGLPVEVVVEGEPRALPVGLELSAYRIAQEALTNVLKHAGPARAVLTLRYADDALTVTVTDDGLGDARDDLRGGHGLVGMGERVASYGGQLTAGPANGRGWTTTARLPLTTATAP